jgi:hypothetical protein
MDVHAENNVLAIKGRSYRLKELEKLSRRAIGCRLHNQALGHGSERGRLQALVRRILPSSQQIVVPLHGRAFLQIKARSTILKQS